MVDSNAVHDVLAEVFATGEPPSEHGTDAVFARATRIRRRQRLNVAAVVGATVVATTAVVVGAASLGVFHGSGQGTAGDPTPTASSACHADRCDAAAPGPAAGGPLGPPDFDVAATLRRLLPQGGSIQKTDTQPGYAGLLVVDAQGTSQITMNVQLDAAKVAPLLDCGGRNLAAGTQCEAVTRPDGTKMLTSDGPDAEGPASVRELQVDVLYPDGRRVVAVEWNAADEVHGPATRQAPLFTLDQLVTLVTAPDWRA